MKVTYYNKKDLKDNLRKKFIIKNYFLKLILLQFSNFCY